MLSIDAGVRVSVDSTYELHALSELAEGSGRDVDIAFRVNPDVSPGAPPPKIATGLATSKFGIAYKGVLQASGGGKGAFRSEPGRDTLPHRIADS